MSIEPGQPIPSATLHEGTPANAVDPAAIFAKGKHILFAVPGAYTPGCSKTHLPGYVDGYAGLKARGVDSIACVAVNDAFVMSAWGEAQGATGKIRMLADPSAAFTRALGLDVNAASLGGTRSKRYAMIIEDGVVKHLQVEPDGFGLSCSLAPSIADLV
ncbi:MAG: peroxiredoxin [Alphaproteobacteria bacterium]|nr:peroxiredoxin [Alphaproteobacteria bacterium]